MSEVVAVDYDFTNEESVAYTLHLMRTRRIYRRQRILTCFLLPTALALLGIAWTSFTYNYLRPPSIWPSVFYFAFVVVYTLYVWLWYEATSRRRLTKMFAQGRNRALLGPLRLELRNDVIWRSSEMSEGWVRWEGVESVETDRDHAYIAVSSNSAFVVPRRAFADAAAFDAFVARATELWRSAQTA